MLTPEFFSEVKEWQLDHIPFEVMWMTEVGEVVYANEALCQQLGYRKNELIGLSIFEINPRLTRERWQSHWSEVVQNGTVNFKTMHARKDGSLYDAEVSAQFFSNNRKDIICAIVNEITQSTFYKRVLDTAESLVKVGGWKINLLDNSIIVTSETLRIFQTDDSEEIRPINAIKYFKNGERFQELISLAITKAQPFDETLGIRDANGEEKWLRCTGLPVIVKDKVKKIIGVYQDITDQYNNVLSLRLFKEIINQSEDIVFVWNSRPSMSWTRTLMKDGGTIILRTSRRAKISAWSGRPPERMEVSFRWTFPSITFTSRGST